MIDFNDATSAFDIDEGDQYRPMLAMWLAALKQYVWDVYNARWVDRCLLDMNETQLETWTDFYRARHIGGTTRLEDIMAFCRMPLTKELWDSLESITAPGPVRAKCLEQVIEGLPCKMRMGPRNG